jgi:hypothetical protein
LLLQILTPSTSPQRRFEVPPTSKLKTTVDLGKTDRNGNRKVGDTFINAVRIQTAIFIVVFSLLPGLKKLSGSRNLHARTTMQKILLEEQQYFSERRGNSSE